MRDFTELNLASRPLRSAFPATIRFASASLPIALMQPERATRGALPRAFAVVVQTDEAHQFPGRFQPTEEHRA